MEIHDSDLQARYDFLMGDPTDTPREIVDGIAIVAPGDAEAIWEAHVSAKHGHLMEMGRAGYSMGVISERIIDANFENHQKTTIAFQQVSDLTRTAPMIFFQTPRSAVVTRWRIVSENWWHFCMATDDNNVGLFPNRDRRLLYMVSRFLVQQLASPTRLSEPHQKEFERCLATVTPR